MKTILLGLIGPILFNVGCVSNPYNEPQAIAEAEAQKHPEHAKDIREQYKELENRKKLNPSPNDTYVIEQEKSSGFALGGPNAAVHLGNNNYDYIHKINLTLACEKDSFLPKPYSRKTIKWKLTDSLFGEVQTSLDGKLHIQVKTNSDQRFQDLILSTSVRSYKITLSEFPIIELDKKECF